jgi:hypothetical protein
MIEPNEKIIDALVTLLESNVGYEITFFGRMLSIYQHEDGRFVVNGDKILQEEVFDNAHEAVEFFEQKRREHEIGFDIEDELYRKEQENSYER